MKPESRFSLDVIDVASPCNAAWDGMQGDDRVRFCSQCRLNVYDLSSMSRDEAERMVVEREGRLCVRFFRRADGTVLTQDCPRGLQAIRRRLAQTITAIATLLMFLTCGIAFGRQQSLRPGAPVVKGPLSRFIEWIDPRVYQIMGGICPPPATNPLPVPPGPDGPIGTECP